MYHNLLRLPYFQGMSKNELTSILEKVKLDFTKLSDSEKIVSQGERCDKFIIVANGNVEAVCTSPDGSYRLHEIIPSPYAIEPYSLFGAESKFRHSYYASGDCNLLSISKSYFFSHFADYGIFTINMLNLISYKAQMQFNRAWQDSPQNIGGKIASFIAERSEIPGGTKKLAIKMEDLAMQISETRINVSHTLNSLQKRGILELKRKEIFIPSFESLIEATKEETI